MGLGFFRLHHHQSFRLSFAAFFLGNMLIFSSCDQEANNDIAPFNVLFIAIDDLRPELGCYGVSEVYSPNIDRLASEGALFTRAYCQMSWCSPSRTSLMTGLYPHHTGVLDLQKHFRTTIPEIKTLPQHFKENGYTALSFGKVYHNSEQLQDSLSWSAPAWLPDHPNPIQAYALEANNELAQSNPYHKASATENAPVADKAYPDGQTTQMAVEAMQGLAQSEEPFFLAVGYYKPHLPFTAPSQYWDHYKYTNVPLTTTDSLPQGAPPYIFRSWSEPGSYLDISEDEPYSDSLSTHLKLGYYACISFIDAQVGQLLDQLETLGIRDNTIVVLWGDHGFKLGEYGRWSKHSTVEVDTRVPLVISAPGVSNSGIKINEIVELVDLYPTLSELAGLPLPRQAMDGKSFTNLLASTGPVEKDHAYSTIVHDGFQAHSLRTHRFRFTAWYPEEQPGQIASLELYDHEKDPYETVNLATDDNYKSIVDRLTGLLSQKINIALK